MCGSRPVLAECLVLWFCVSLLCDRHRLSCVHPYRVGVPVVGRTVFRLPINQSLPTSARHLPHLALGCLLACAARAYDDVEDDGEADLQLMDVGFAPALLVAIAVALATFWFWRKSPVLEAEGEATRHRAGRDRGSRIRACCCSRASTTAACSTSAAELGHRLARQPGCRRRGGSGRFARGRWRGGLSRRGAR